MAEDKVDFEKLLETLESQELDVSIKWWHLLATM